MREMNFEKTLAFCSKTTQGGREMRTVRLQTDGCATATHFRVPPPATSRESVYSHATTSSRMLNHSSFCEEYYQ